MRAKESKPDEYVNDLKHEKRDWFISVVVQKHFFFNSKSHGNVLLLMKFPNRNLSVKDS